MEIKRKCIKCGMSQEKDKNKSVKEWAVYDCKVKCKCGGKYGTYIDGDLIGGD